MSEERIGTTEDAGEATAAAGEETASTDGDEPAIAGHVHDVGMLDLRFAKVPEDLSGITRISDVGIVLIPEPLMGALMHIPMNDVGAVVPMPQGVPMNCLMGQTRLTGDALAGGDAETVLFIAGQLFITTPLTSIGYKEIRVTGQLFAPRGSEAVLTAKLGQMNGQIFYLPANPRVIMGEETIGQAFLSLLPEPAPIVIMGQLTFEEDVTVELLQSKVPEIVLMGQIVAPAALLPLVQILTREKMGEIVAKA